MDPSFPVSMVQAGGIFSWDTLGTLVWTEHHLNVTAYLNVVAADHLHLFMTTVYHLLMASSSRISHFYHKAQIISNLKIRSLYSNTLHSDQMSIHRSTFGMWWTSAWSSHTKMIQNLSGVSSTLLNLCHDKLWEFWKQKGFKPATGKV